VTTTDPLTRALADRSRVVTNPVVLAGIRERMEWARLPWWRRVPWRRPQGYGTGRFGL